MRKLTVLALRIVLAGLLAGSLFVQVVMVPIMAIDLADAGEDVARVRTPFLVIVVLSIVTIQVTLVCVWRLLTMVRRGTVFSDAAFRWVDVIIGAANVYQCAEENHGGYLAHRVATVCIIADDVEQPLAMCMDGLECALTLACAGRITPLNLGRGGLINHGC